MLRAANRYYTTRIVAGFAILLGAWFALSTLLSNAASENRIARASALADALYTAPTSAIPYASENLNSVRDESIDQLENDLASTESRDIKLRAAIALTTLGIDKSEYLVDEIAHADADERDLIVASLAHFETIAIEAIRSKIKRAKSVEEKLPYLMASLDFGEFEFSKPVVKIDSTPGDRTDWIVEFGRSHHRWDQIIGLLDREGDESARSVLLLGTALFPADAVDPVSRERLTELALEYYRSDPSSVVHSVSRLLLEKWNTPVPAIQTIAIDDQTNWRTTPHGHTMIRVPKGVAPRWNSRLFTHNDEEVWISDSEVNFEQFMEFFNDPKVDVDDKPYEWVERMTKSGDYPFGQKLRGTMKVNFIAGNQPVDFVNQQDAIMYCNWLSRREGLVPYYQRTDKRVTFGTADQSNPPEERSTRWIWIWKPNDESNGYRLPFDNEWLIAMAAFSKEKFFLGGDLKNISAFAVIGDPKSGTSRTSSQPCRSYLPNNLGFFDLTGNVKEYCHDHVAIIKQAQIYSMACEMGNSFRTPANRLQFDSSMYWPNRDIDTGFRIARKYK